MTGGRAEHANALYLTDGPILLSAANGGISQIGTYSSVPYAIFEAGDYVAATELISPPPSVTTQAETLRKSDARLTLIEAPSARLQVLGANSQTIAIVGTAEAGQAFVLASGDNQARQTVGSQFVGLVRSASGLPDQPGTPVALLSCTASTTKGFCAPGPLDQLDISAPNVVTSLGTP